MHQCLNYIFLHKIGQNSKMFPSILIIFGELLNTHIKYTYITKHIKFVHKMFEDIIKSVCSSAELVSTTTNWWAILQTYFAELVSTRGGDKSLGQPGKKATATKLGIYSTYSPRSSIHFLVRCYKFCKPLKKNSECCPTNQVSAVAMTSAPDKNWRPFNCFFSPGKRW